MTETLHVEGLGAIELTLSERGEGRPLLLLHGGAGPLSLVPWAELYAATRGARVITPVHPGFMGTPRPAALDSPAKLARVYAAFIRQRGLDGVTVVGNSIGGWIAAELALLAPELVRRLVLVDAAGIELPGHPVANVFQIAPQELMALSYHDPARFGVDFSKLTPEQRAAGAANMATLKVYGGDMTDASLRARLARVTTPTLVVWGESDRVVDVEYGKAYAAAIPGARFELVAAAGHLPQIEAPQRLSEVVASFVA